MKKSHVTEFFGMKSRTWVWCLHCERSYRVGEHREGTNRLQMCHYSGCDGDAVLDVCRWEDIRERHSEYPEVPELNVVYSLY